ncbi:MAG: hypothetical protein JRJ85_12325, partial [Deltaproteobacteria bacterium]|nr:hypothetical protein [Deltaproteobacteria bacterium]
MNWLYRQLFKLFNLPLLRRWAGALVPYRLWVILFVHCFLFSLSYLTATLILYEGLLSGEVHKVFYRTLGPLILIRMGVYWHHDLHQGLWRFVSFQDLLNIIRATIISSILFLVAGALWNPLRIPQALMLLDTTFCIMFVGGIRFMVRNIRETFLHARPAQGLKNVLMVGPLGQIQPLVKEFLGNPYSLYRPAAILDPEKTRDASMTRLNDIPVFSIQEVLAKSRTLSELH